MKDVLSGPSSGLAGPSLIGDFGPSLARNPDKDVLYNIPTESMNDVLVLNDVLVFSTSASSPCSVQHTNRVHE